MATEKDFEDGQASMSSDKASQRCVNMIGPEEGRNTYHQEKIGTHESYIKRLDDDDHFW